MHPFRVEDIEESDVFFYLLCVQEGEEEADEENDPDYDPKVRPHTHTHPFLKISGVRRKTVLSSSQLFWLRRLFLKK